MDFAPAQFSKFDDVECWDDDLDLQGIDDLNLRSFSTNTVGTSNSNRGSHHRDSLSSRLSSKSDFDEESNWQLLLPPGDEMSAQNAIADAKTKGVPIPMNVPSSALVGGTIKRLGGKKVKRVLGEEWGDDLELPRPGESGLRLKLKNGGEFPDTLRNVSIASPTMSSPEKPKTGLSFMERLQSAGAATLDKFKDTSDDDFGDIPTIKVAKSRVPMTIPNFNQPVSKPKEQPSWPENFEDDLEIPVDGDLKLSTRKEPPKTPASQMLDEIDPDWADGSQGSFGTSLGTRRTNRSSSVSVLSPSVFSPSLSSCLTAESEDEGLEGLVLPNGPLKLQEALEKRMETLATEAEDPEEIPSQSPIKEDFLSGIELGDGEVYDAKKLTLNRNIKAKTTRTQSPTRRTAMTLTFTNKPSAVTTRIPKPTGLDRHRAKLEPVSESGGPVATYKRSQSRLAPHSTHAAPSGIPTATIAPPSAPMIAPSTPSRRTLTSRVSRDGLRPEPSMTSSHALKSKRSMPTLSSGSFASPSRSQPSTQRPPSRVDRFTRPKTPVERLAAETGSTLQRKPPVPSFSVSNANKHSQHSAKPNRNYHRPTSSDSNSNENVPVNRSISRLSNSRQRPTTPTARKDVAPEALAQAAASQSTLTRPRRRQVFGDGNELDIFDDLPTSAAAESKFVKHPTGSLSKVSTSLRSKLYSLQNQSTTSVSRVEAKAEPRTPLTPQKHDSNVPSWARDTAASRLARQQRIGNAQHPAPRVHPPAVDRSLAINATLKTPMTPARPAAALPRHQVGSKRHHKPPQQHKPHLIQGLGSDVYKVKQISGMHYNPDLFRWEGNENALAPFDVPASPKHRIQPNAGAAVGTPTSTKPALIASVGAVKGIQVVGGMVFDPQHMRWLKMAPTQGSGNAPSRGRSESGGRSLATEDDEEDPFAGLDDLEDDMTKSRAGGARGVTSDDTGAGSSDEERILGEEFDVGPEFVRRQQNEEDRWRRKLQGWKAVTGEISTEEMLQGRSAIRVLLQQG